MHYVKAKGIFTSDYGINLYRGCTHGCIYCDSRSEIYGMNHKFEDIQVKENAVELLKKELVKRKPSMIGTGAMTDPYIPLEKINEKTKAVVQVTITTADDELCKMIEPNVCPTSRRVEVLEKLKERNIPTVVWFCPILPYINDTEENVNRIMDCCIDADVRGVLNMGMGLSLRKGNREYFYRKLDEKFPGIKEKYIEEFGDSYFIHSSDNRKLRGILRKRCDEHGIMHNQDEIFSYIHEFPEKTVQSKLL